MKRRNVLILSGIVSLMIIGIVAIKVLGKEEIKILGTEKIVRCDIDAYIVETGMIKPRVGALVKVGARATGTIDKMYVKIGDRVKKGQLIALIDSREIEKEIRRTEAELEVAKNRLIKIEALYPKMIDEARATLNAKESNYSLSQIDLKSAEELFQKGYISQNELDRKSTAFEEARAERDVADKTLQRIIKEFEAEKNVAVAETAKYKSLLNQQKIRLSYTNIYAPIDGVVSDITAQEGETIVAGLQVANLISILNPSMLEMHIFVDETEIGQIQRRQKVEYSVDTYPDRKFIAQVDDIYPQPVVKDNIVYYMAISYVPAEDAEYLRPEMTTHVKILTASGSNVLCVSNSAVKFEAGKHYVYTVEGKNAVKRRDIGTGLRGEEKTEVLSGLNEGDEVATRIIIPVDLEKVKNKNR